MNIGKFQMDDKKIEEAVKALLMLRSDIIEHGRKIEHKINEQQRALSNESEQFRHQINGIVREAGQGIDKAAKQSLDSVNQDYRRAVDDITGKVANADRVIKKWQIGGGVFLLCALIAMSVLMYFLSSSLSEKKAELQNYENALEVAKAYTNSDAYICGNRLCIKPGQNMGNGYQKAKERNR